MTLRLIPGKTARRLQWHFLPPALRSGIEKRLGSTVVAAVSQDSGFTPGMASVLTCADGSKHFVKAASLKAQRPFALAYREEARKLQALPEGTPAARLQWLIDDDWVVLGIEYAAATLPHRPWRSDELDRCLDALERAADVLTPAPPGLGLRRFADDFADLPDCWTQIRADHLDPAHRAEAAGLASGFAAVTGGDTVVHTDLRADNTLITADGEVLFCDWNWLATGAPWIDTVIYLIEAAGDGLDVDQIIATRRLTKEVPADHIDTLIALIAGYYLKSADDPVPPTSPHLRDFQAWNADAAWGWLSRRRAW